MALNVKANNATRARNRIFGILIAICLIVFVCVMTAIGSAESKKTISVVKLKEDTPIKANSLVTEDMIEKYDMYYKEFEQYGTIRFSDGTVRSSIVNFVKILYCFGIQLLKNSQRRIHIYIQCLVSC